jgi:putative ATP-binding cassette transporter
MKLLSFLWGAQRSRLLLAMLTSLLAGVGNALLVALISRRLLSTSGLAWTGYALFGVLFSAVLLFDFGAKRILSHLTADITTRLRIQLARQITELELPRLEEIGPARLLAILTEDVFRLSQLVNTLPTLGMAVATSVACVAYLGWLAPGLLAVLGVVALPAIGGFWLIQNQARRLLSKAQQARDVLVQHFRAVTEGVKELKLHAGRRADFFASQLQPAAAEVNRWRNIVHDRQHLAATWSQALYFVFILVVFLLADWQGLPLAVVSGYALIILYLRGSLLSALNGLPLWSEANVALQRIEALGFTLTTASLDQFSIECMRSPSHLARVVGQVGNLSHPQPDTQQKTDISSQPNPPAAAPFQQIELRGVAYHYSDGFTLGPLDLVLQPGELVFVAGGNGSGKTTLLKLLTGLYAPTAGTVFWNGQSVTAANVEAYRQNFSVIFAEPFLFDRLLGLSANTLDQQAQAYLEQLELTRKVQVQDGRFSTTNLSHGQRKRLALLTAYLEDRPVYVFDEWAAGQDPEFREVFYHCLLPELKARGKLVLAITHDDRYFGEADRLVKLELGKITADGIPTTSQRAIRQAI